jgi:SAM-dependent methyltransferase
VNADERNAGQIAYWNGPGGLPWVELQDSWDVVLAPVAAAAIARAAIRPGERVVDIGCGCGATTVELAGLAGHGGKVLGIDVSKPMLARAAARLPSGPGVELVLDDATTHAFSRGGYDVLFSRFGVMFFAEPSRSFSNLRSALRPGGRMVFSCFRAPQQNPWMMVPAQAAYQHVPAPSLDPDAPGPFAFAREDRVRGILADAGFESIGMEPFDLELDIASGRGLDWAIETAFKIGATGRAVQGQPPEIRRAVADSVRRVLAPYEREGHVALPAAIWLVSAISP